MIETSTKYNRYAARIPKGMGSGGGLVGSLSLDVQGWGHRVQSGPIRTDRKSGEGGVCKNWTFFMDVINVWSLMKPQHVQNILKKRVWSFFCLFVCLFVLFCFLLLFVFGGETNLLLLT